MKKTILWDFDGVLIDSMHVRDLGFKEIFKDYEKKQINKLLKFHRKNGGLSRYVKIRYFFEKLIKINISENEVKIYAENFSKIMKSELKNPKYLINESVDFVKKNYRRYNFHIVSGSDQKELRFLIKELGLNKYFLSVFGSPKHKNDLVSDLIICNKYNRNDVCLIGDSINDLEAAKFNNITFFGYNNPKLKNLASYITKLSQDFFE